MNRLIPNDVDYCLAFSRSGSSFSFQYEDGNTGGFFPAPFPVDDSLLGNLCRIDWDGFRADALKAGGVFSELESDALDRPVNIPSTADAQREHEKELEEFVKDEGCVEAPFAILAFRDSFGPEFERTVCRTRGDLIRNLADLCTCGYDIISILCEGGAFEVDQIESLKREAIDGLGPISKALAEGRLGGNERD